jgi:hypothetical protein
LTIGATDIAPVAFGSEPQRIPQYGVACAASDATSPKLAIVAITAIHVSHFFIVVIPSSAVWNL